MSRNFLFRKSTTAPDLRVEVFLKVEEGDLAEHRRDVVIYFVVEGDHLLLFAQCFEYALKSELFEQGRGGFGDRYRMSLVDEGLALRHLRVYGVPHLMRKRHKRFKVIRMVKEDKRWRFDVT